MKQFALHWENVSFYIRSGFWMKKVTLVNDINLKIPSGTVLGLVGKNGAGKTTTIKLGAGLLSPSCGMVNINGLPANNHFIKSSIGLLTENQYIYPYLRLKEWLMMLGGLSGMSGKHLKKRVEAVSSMVELNNFSDKLMKNLSKGQMQRAGFAQVFLHEPEILLLDEPMSGLDPYWRYRFQQILIDFKKSGGTVLFSSHIMADVEKISDHVALMNKGKIVWSGKISDLPRKTKGYEVVCRSIQPELLENIPFIEKLNLNPDENYRFVVPKDKKEDILKIAASKSFMIESLQPLQEEIEEVLFGFTKKQ